MKQIVAKFVSKAMFLPVLVAGSAFAEGEASDPLQGASDAADTIGGAVKGLLEGAVMDNVKDIVLASLAIWGLLLVVRWIRRAGR